MRYIKVTMEAVILLFIFTNISLVYGKIYQVDTAITNIVFAIIVSFRTISAYWLIDHTKP